MDNIEQIFDDVTSWLIRELEKKNAPWVRPWTGGKIFIGGRVYPIADWPSNIRSPGAYYSPLNHVFLLQQVHIREEEFKSNFWITPEALEELGAKPNGEPYLVINRFLSDRSGYAGRIREMYHVEQIEDCEQSLGFSFGEPGPQEFTYTESKRVLDVLVKHCELEIREGARYAAFHPMRDVVSMPRLGQFDDEREREGHYWATVWHEVVHWTGHESRLNREFSGILSHRRRYALEELVAETGAAYLCAHFGIAGQLQHAEYVDSWLEVLKDERGKALSMAFAASQKATRWIVEQSTRRAAQRSQLSKSDAPALPVKGAGEAEIGSIPP